MTEPAYPTTLIPAKGALIDRLLHHVGSLDMKCERLLDAQVKTAFIKLLPEDVEAEVAIDPSVQALITIECPFSGPVDVDWRYQSSLRTEDEEQVGDWTCPVCGEAQEVTR